MPELKILIVDDEAPARGRLRELLGDIAGELPNRVVGEAGDGVAAIAQVEATAPDVVLTDIRMPRMDGIELARHLGRMPVSPAIVFATAFDAYAMQAFDLNAVDYLLKPVRAARLAAALAKARVLHPPADDVLAGLQPEGRSHLSCHERGRILLVPVSDILYLRADLKYVTARTREREYLLDESLTHLEEEFASRFIRLHRSVLVAKEAIVGFERNTSDDADTHWLALVRDVPERLPVSRRQWSQVKNYARQLST